MIKFLRTCESYFVSTFILGLKNDLQVYVLRHHPCTVIDAYGLACIQEYSLHSAVSIDKCSLADGLHMEGKHISHLVASPFANDDSEVVISDSVLLIGVKVLLQGYQIMP